jgi:cyclic pyranopterin phosphate synthase
MIDITKKKTTLRSAVATATISFNNPKTFTAIKEQTVPKGNVFETAKIAGLMAFKNTALAIPHCHPLPIEFADINFKLDDNRIVITSEIKTIYKTGAEVEALYAATVAAITCYDMLKQIDNQILIQEIKIVEKTGGKENLKKLPQDITAGIIVCSNKKVDKEEESVGYLAKQKLESFDVSVNHLVHVELDSIDIEREFRYCLESEFNLIILIGGTGISQNDITPDIILPYFEKRLFGVEETMRSYGQMRTPYAMLSRSLVGVVDKSIVMVLPGSKNGMLESFEAVFPEVLHSFWMFRG